MRSRYRLRPTIGRKKLAVELRIWQGVFLAKKDERTHAECARTHCSASICTFVRAREATHTRAWRRNTLTFRVSSAGHYFPATAMLDTPRNEGWTNFQGRNRRISGRTDGRTKPRTSDRDKWIARAICHFVTRNEFSTTQKSLLRFVDHVSTFSCFYNVLRLFDMGYEFILFRSGRNPSRSLRSLSPFLIGK